MFFSTSECVLLTSNIQQSSSPLEERMTSTERVRPTAMGDDPVSRPMRSPLFWIMQAINVLSLGLLVTPLTFHYVLGVSVRISNTDNYVQSIQMFLPTALRDLVFPRQFIPTQIWDIEGTQGTLTHIYFPGVAVDTTLGMLQGLALGSKLLFQRPSGRLSQPWIPALSLYFFALMCFSALPLHCLRDLGHLDQDLGSPTILGYALNWIDTSATATSVFLAFLSTLVEYKRMDSNSATSYAMLGINVCFTLVAWGVAHGLKTLVAFMHVGVFMIALPPMLVFMWKQHSREKSARTDGLVYTLVAHGVFIVSGLPLVVCALNASAVAEWTNGMYCSMTSFFVASRIAAVQFWAYCDAQSRFKSDQSTTTSEDLRSTYNQQHIKRKKS